MKSRIFRSICSVALLCIFLCYICMVGVLYRLSFENMKTMIRDEAVYIVAALNNGDRSGLEATKATFTRVTLISADGTVVFDSREDTVSMENHAQRPEIVEAFRTGASEARRYSETLAVQSYYRAIRLQNGQVVRVSGDMDSVWVMSLRYMPFIALAFLAAFLASVGSARVLARRIATPLNSIDLDHPLSNEVYEELAPLLRRMEQQRVEIEAQLFQMEEKRREFDAVAGNMREGLILLGKSAEVLSINRSARDILELPGDECIGTHILELHRDEAFHKTVRTGLEGATQETTLNLSGKQYQLLCNPVEHAGKVSGAVLLLLDITDKRQAEQMRREFSANVSHELKTPLTSISGYAEIMKNGMVKPEDVPLFAERIFGEARRLINLVEDILRLSRLDEKNDEPVMEPVDLYALSERVLARYLPAAEERSIAMDLRGGEAVVQGIPAILEEIIGNLLDNAVKYNRDGGSVVIAVSDKPEGVRLSVADTGIGIAREHQERVFERFYRVDKSHSKETGGTGLGLSIVKHGAALHRAKLHLDSREGEGSQISLLFPRPHT